MRSTNAGHGGRTVSLSEPHLWFADARRYKRHVICHVGPTNSGKFDMDDYWIISWIICYFLGKTYEALKALENAPLGLYCGPLRLLAVEVNEKLRALGIRCSLITGNERDVIDGHTHVSSTVEMVDLYRPVDLAVVDECQLLGDPDRGSSWTYAILGIQCRELHLCGSTAMLPVIKKICSKTGDTLEIKEYKRLSSLSVAKKSIKSFKAIQPGDCVVAFSKRAVYDFKKIIEQTSEHRCCVI